MLKMRILIVAGVTISGVEGGDRMMKKKHCGMRRHSPRGGGSSRGRAGEKQVEWLENEKWGGEEA